MTPERFAQLIVSDDVVLRIKSYRERLPELAELKRQVSEKEALIDANPDPDSSMNKELKAEIKSLKQRCQQISAIKSGLPVLMYQATFDETVSKNGNRGRWRKQSAARLNGLYMVDYDHVGGGEKVTPQGLFDSWVEDYVRENPEAESLDAAARRAAFCHSLGIVLAHVTSSGDGLRLVGIADAARGNLADNQAWITTQLSGVTPDKACKDASRASFCPGFEDILYINKKELFDYDNKEYDEKWAPLYRGGHSKPAAVRSNGGNEPAGTAGKTPDAAVHAGNGGQQGAAADNNGLAGRIEEGYHGRKYEEIIRQWFAKNGGVPKTGDRHQTLYRLAMDLRYITDFDPDLLARLLTLSDTGKEICAERGDEEIARIAADACTARRYGKLPGRMAETLAAAGVQQDGGKADAHAQAANIIDYDVWARRTEDVLRDDTVLSQAVSVLPPRLKLAGVLAAGAMLGTYLTRCWWEHFDGKEYRLSFLVYIIGSAASGKSFITDLDRLIMAPMQAADRAGRNWERKYREDMKKRAASSKNARQEAPEQLHPVVRYLPSSTSNAVLYRRLTDAIDEKCMDSEGQPMHLHCYTCEAELATALRAQTGSWAGKNDLELKSFQNEYAGVDFANDQSVNGIIQINWNQVVSGTREAMNRKIKPSTVLDGLVTRLVLFPMPSNDFQMIKRRKVVRDHEREAMLRSIGIKLEEVAGELKCERLVDFCYEYERKLCLEADLEQDACLDYFRKRIPLIMMRYTLVRMVCRQLCSEPQPPDTGGCTALEVLDSDLDFAQLIGDWCLMAQMYMFGEAVMEARERENSSFQPRRRTNATRTNYQSLPEKSITPAMMVERGMSTTIHVACATLSRWEQQGLLKRVERGMYDKIIKNLDV